MASLREELQQIYNRHGSLTPKGVVAEARDPQHALHNHFEWDDSIAGEKYREQQAAVLIRSVRIVYREASEEGPKRTVRAFQSVPTSTGYEYRPTSEVAEDPVAREVVLAQMRREWKALQARYAQFTEFVEMVLEDLDAQQNPATGSSEQTA